MSKSRGNVVNPDDVIAEFGADAFRLYEMFMGPLMQVKPWNTRDVSGVARFLNRVWRLLLNDEASGPHARVQDIEPNKDQLRTLHQAIKKVGDDIESLSFNTAISAMMEFTNAANQWDAVPLSVAVPFVQLLSPFAPHIAEELWEKLGQTELLTYAPWPEVVEDYLKEDQIEMAVQVNGKVRATITMVPGAPKDEVLALAKEQENVQRFTEGKTIRKEIYVPGRIINIVAT